VNGKMKECANLLMQGFREEYKWIEQDEAAGNSPILQLEKSELVFEVTLLFKHMSPKEKRFEFSAHELSIDDQYRMDKKHMQVGDIKVALLRMGFDSEIAALDTNPNIEARELWPLLFLQLGDKPDWRTAIQEKLLKLKGKVCYLHYILDLRVMCPCGLVNIDCYLGILALFLLQVWRNGRQGPLLWPFVGHRIGQ
jgi:hypothetical protein